MTINFDQLYADLKSGVETIAKNSLQNYEAQAKTDGINALDNLKTNLSNWAQEVENGALTKEDLEFLLQSEESLNEMVTLKQAGLAAIQIDKFKNSLINLVISTITGLIKV